MTLLTRTEEMILLAVWHLDNNAYGVTIRHQHLSDVVGKRFSIGAIYVPLDRLTQKGYLATTHSDPTPERGGRSKRFYQLTQDGLQALQQSKAIHDTLWAGFPQPT